MPFILTGTKSIPISYDPLYGIQGIRDQDVITVGIHNTGSTSSACVMRNGKVEFAAAEERFNRNKHWRYFPQLAMERGLAMLGCSINQVDRVAIAWNPAINLAGRFRAGFSEWPAYPGARLYSNASQILTALHAKPSGGTEQRVELEGGRSITFDYVDHHLSHAAFSYLPSPFEEAAILIVDGYGERASTVFGVGRGPTIDILRRDNFPHSVGSFYSAVTQHLGFRPDQDEWKVMGAAAYGDPEPYRQAMKQLISLHDDGHFRLDLNLFDHFDFDSPSLLSVEGKALLGQSRVPEDEMEQRHFNIAAAAQEQVEEVMFHLLKWLKQRTGLDAICLGGGVVMNSVFNGRTTLEGPFSRVHIPFAPDDSGNAIGAALVAAQRATATGKTLRAPVSPYLGPEYTDSEIEDLLRRYQIAGEKQKNPAKTGAQLIASGKTLGWFQGRMEFGQRALGNRSILADPRDPGMRDKINASVKYREQFRPFAPAVSEHSAHEYFEIPETAGSPFMERVFKVRTAKQAMIPAVVHADGSGRLQTVNSTMNPLFHALIEAFRAETGVPVVLNTSFNTSGEPIVQSPEDALRTFFTSGLNALILGNYLIEK